MSTTRKIVFYFALIAGTLLILITLLSLFYNVKFWYLKMLDFPRMQILFGLLTCLILFAVVNKTWKLPSWLLMAGLLTSLVLQATFVLPYTPFVDKAVPTAQKGPKATKESFSLVLANVWMKNNNTDAFLKIVLDANPDMLLAMETNNWWVERLAPLRSKYPYKIEYPLDNTYGMALYSRLPLRNTALKFLHHPDVPSILADVQLPNGQTFRLYAVHPVPPMPSKYPTNVGEKEVALLKVGEMVTQQQLPTLVAGDFNDVAWSNTSRLFGTTSKLSDIRIGRGLYSTFDATSYIMRWPLDHVYVSDEFSVIDIKKLPKYGSDHFAFRVDLVLNNSN